MGAHWEVHMLTQEYVRELFDYRDGVLYWKVRRYKVTVGMTAGCLNKNNYMVVRIDYIRYQNHRVIWLYHYGTFPAKIDHINNISTDNMVENLRPATTAENNCNTLKRKNNKSGVKGVYWNKESSKWAAGISKGGHRHHLGYFVTLSDAEAVVKSARMCLHGEFANHG